MQLKHLLPMLTVCAVTSLPTDARSKPADALAQWHAGIQQGYQSLADSTASLQARATAYCRSPSDSSRAALEEQWQDAFLDWQAIRFVDFGPIERDSLAWQFQFWPDPKNLIARKAGYFLELDQPVTAREVDDAGVAVQGFPMIEYLLFDAPLNDGEQALPAEQACSLLTAISEHVADNAEALVSDWTGLEARYLDAAPYRETTVEAGMAALSLLEDRRLGGPMGLRGGGKRSVYGADAWRSGRSLAAIRASLQGLQDYYLPGLATALAKTGNTELADRIRVQFADTLNRFESLPDAMSPLLADHRFGELQGLYADLSQLASLVSDQAGPALGVVRGFNSSDGD